MLEGKNLEILQELAKPEAYPKKSLRENLIEIAEAVVLSLIAVATAWCGYQAAKWEPSGVPVRDLRAAAC